MAWSNIDDVYKIQNFNSDQGKRFNKYKTAEPPFETYNIMEGFQGENTNNVYSVRQNFDNAQKAYFLKSIPRTNENIFVDRNDDVPDMDVKCIPRTNTSSTDVNTIRYNSYNEAKIACKSLALNNSPQHSVYTIDASYNNINGTDKYNYTCSTSNTPIASTFSINDVRTINIKPLYKLAKPIPFVIPMESRFVKSPTAGTYAMHKQICERSNGKWTMASITSQKDYDDLMTVYTTIIPNRNNSSEHIILGGYRTSNAGDRPGVNRRGVNTMGWTWDDGSAWDMEIANGNSPLVVPKPGAGVGWGGGEPNDWAYTDFNNTRDQDMYPLLYFRGGGGWGWMWSGWNEYNTYINSTNKEKYFYFYRKRGVTKSEDEYRAWVLDNTTNNRKMIDMVAGQHVLVMRPYGPAGTWDDHYGTYVAYAIYKEWSPRQYSATLAPNGALSFNVLGSYKGEEITGTSGAMNAENSNIQLPKPISGCSPEYGGGLNIQSVNLNHKYNCLSPK